MDFLAMTLASILSAGTPMVLATLGETLTERAGVINLSLDGTILLAAMSAFALAFLSGNPWWGLVASCIVGMATASVVALVGPVLGRSQLAVGFVLTLLCKDLAYFLGSPYARQLGPVLPVWSIPVIRELPFLGPILGYQSPVTYLSLLLTVVLSWWLFSTQSGLELRAVGEEPWAAFARGIGVRRLRIIYTLIGGALVGLAGGAFSLAVKPGWGRPQGAEGAGWIALAIVIFGGWHPLRATLGAYLFASLQVLGLYLQEQFPGLPAPIFQVAPFPLMILTLLVVNMGKTGWFQDLTLRYPGLKGWLTRWQVTAPSALGQDFRPEKES